MRVPSGSTDRYLYFVAVDATDLKTRKTGLSSFTVQRSRNGAAETAFTTPTVAEIDAVTMPGVYALKIDEDTTIDAGHDEQEVCVHITHAGMAPVSRSFELYRPKATEGKTATVEDDGMIHADVKEVAGSTIQQAGGYLRARGTDDAALAPAGTALSTVQWTNGRASNLDNLDASISSLNNLSALSNLYGAPLLEIPDSGSIVYAFTLVVRDNEGKLKNLDGSPTIAAANAAGTDRSANLSAVSNPATGRYTFTYTVASDAAEESLRITASGTVSAEARYNEWIGAVVDYDTLTTLLAVKAKTDLLPSDPADQSAVEAAITAAQGVITSAISALNNLSQANVRTAIGLAAPNLDSQLATLATAAVLALVKAVTDKLDTMLQLEGAGPDYQFTEPALAEAPTGGGGGGGPIDGEYDFETDRGTKRVTITSV